MRSILSYLSDFWKNEVKVAYLICIASFLALSIFIEYYFHASAKILGPHKQTIWYLWGHCILYAMPLVFALLSYILIYKKKELLKNLKLWFVVLFIIFAYAFRAYFYQHKQWAFELNDGVYDPFIYKTINQIAQALLVFLPVFFYWLVSGHYKTVPFYGFSLKKIQTKPYFILLLLMLPLILIASTQKDFLERYPMCQNLLQNSSDSGFLTSLKVVCYEFFYGLDYVATELFFRGFVIYVLGSFLGLASIIPMATMYVFIHFGKPLGETISSFFGGTILGVIAYRTNSIAGGVIVHCGIAWLMEVGGFWGRYFF